MGESGLAQLAHGGFPGAVLADVPHGRAEGDPGLGAPHGASALEAAGVIHTDFKRGFIKAEIVSYDDLIA